MKQWMLLLTVFTVVAAMITGCGPQAASAPAKFVIAYLPQESDTQTQQTYKAFETKLSEAIGMPVESYKATSYNAAIEAMRNNKADIAMFGPFSYIVAVERAGVEPIVGVTIPAMTESPASVIIVPKDSPIEKLEDLKGKTFGFVDPVSTTGHLFPKATLVKKLGLTAEELDTSFFKSVQFAGKHDNAVIGVVRGQYDAAAMSAMIPDMLVQRGLIEKDSYRILASSEAMAPVTPLAIRSGIPQETKEKVKSFLLGYQDPAYFKAVMNSDQARFVEVKDSAFDPVRETAKLLHLSPEQLLNH
ncbi:phosphate/phosphite/phosphonate ABC transporter substrate-binding protein [Paenibacillus mucilaginosus]|uniref:Phosphonate ABC transporter substrate-binding protein n=3 Tax=Paenibacillus mucilaginosus TaxID=61624 RepID=H6NI36_9BACL|nr:phosphate/phosphite/phosphonate ABC transporter substrate-binding protein [Paenibacillus mucilaginosus]AEI43140.1 phosphonate ABC transporter, periplasmic phosphonate-binding protein [Paenibacillus mucilaginosus KNP414]AFC30807.1 phosphonate ABC transporter substrate-binding protein [Paenibacillus mucilaginosus 3016]AFH63129.1 phosphonate ABC transporter substrate-binding protein [Paenibacillus mucilaginosus K02]MCG7212293.1 phosphate/phosphite/phosphonate ABC transporter substrate-binding p